jgi:hypothetical protein
MIVATPVTKILPLDGFRELYISSLTRGQTVLKGNKTTDKFLEIKDG